MPTVTLKDVAKVAGVSYATVSRALSGSPEISEETRRRILKLCKEMGYTPNSVARSMVKRYTNVLGLIVPSLNNPFMSELTGHLEIYARNRGYTLMVCNSSYDYDLEKEVFSLLVGRQVDGIIMIPVGGHADRHGIPLLPGPSGHPVLRRPVRQQDPPAAPGWVSFLL